MTTPTLSPTPLRALVLSDRMATVPEATLLRVAGEVEKGRQDALREALLSEPTAFGAILLNSTESLPSHWRLAIRHAASAGVRVLVWEERYSTFWGHDTFEDCGAVVVRSQEALEQALSAVWGRESEALHEPLTLPARQPWPADCVPVVGLDGRIEARTLQGSPGRADIAQLAEHGATTADACASLVAVYGMHAAVRQAAMRVMLRPGSEERWRNADAGWSAIPMVCTDDDMRTLAPEIVTALARVADQPDGLGTMSEWVRGVGLEYSALTFGEAMLARLAAAVPESVASWPQSARWHMGVIRSRWEEAEFEHSKGAWGDTELWVKHRQHLDERRREATPASSRHPLRRECVREHKMNAWSQEVLEGPLSPDFTTQTVARACGAPPAHFLGILEATPARRFQGGVATVVSAVVAGWGAQAETISPLLVAHVCVWCRQGRKRLAHAVLRGVLDSAGWPHLPGVWWHAIAAAYREGVLDKHDGWRLNTHDTPGCIAPPDHAARELLRPLYDSLPRSLRDALREGQWPERDVVPLPPPAACVEAMMRPIDMRPPPRPLGERFAARPPR